VVTAGHCVHGARRKSIRVTLGEYTLYHSVEPLPKQEFVVDELHLHPYYRFTPQADRYDVAVIKLERPAIYQPHIRKGGGQI
jgi:transmembrane serine protease 6